MSGFNNFIENTVSIVGEDVKLGSIGTPTYDSVQDWSDNTQSAGIMTGGVITDDLSGGVDISSCTGILKTTNSATGENVFFDLAGVTGQALTDNSVNYIAIDYNSGTPQFTIGTTSTANGYTIFNLGKVYREGTALDIIDSGLNIYDFQKRVQQHHVEKDMLEFVSGAVVSETGTRNIAVTAGVMYAGLNRIPTDAINTSGSDTFEYYYNDGAWQETDASAINNTQYNDYGTGLATLSNNQYGVHFVYKGTNGTTYVIYGTDSYTLTEAQLLGPPTSLPDHVAGFGVLRAKVIIAKSGTTFTELDQYSGTETSATSPSNHNDLGGIQGGTSDEYYHLTSAEHTALAKTFSTEASSATPTIDTDDVHSHSITALATAITSMTTNLDGTPSNFQKLTIRIKDNGTARAIAWGTSFEAAGADLPTTTTASKLLTVGLIYNSVTSKWGCVAVATEA